MPRRDDDSQTAPQGTDYVTIRELDARIDTVKSELRWHKWVLLLLVAATISPKVGGPAAEDVAHDLLRTAAPLVAGL